VDKGFSELKAPRKLEWRPHLGHVELSLTVGDEKRDYSVSPVLATILMAFAVPDTDGGADTIHDVFTNAAKPGQIRGRRARWLARDLATYVGLELGVLKKRAAYWVSEGILRQQIPTAGDKKNNNNKINKIYAKDEDDGDGDDDDVVYVRSEALERHDAGGDEDHVGYEEEEDTDGQDNEDENQEEVAQMRVYEQFVLGMLTNFPSLPLARIFNMLKMFVMDGGFNKTEQQLQALLNNMVEEGKLVRNGSDEYGLKRE